jgi:hypothetical protein
VAKKIKKIKVITLNTYSKKKSQKTEDGIKKLRQKLTKKEGE